MTKFTMFRDNETRQEFQTRLARYIIDRTPDGRLYEMGVNYLMIEFDERTDKDLYDIAVERLPAPLAAHLIEEFGLEDNEND